MEKNMQCSICNKIYNFNKLQKHNIKKKINGSKYYLLVCDNCCEIFLETYSKNPTACIKLIKGGILKAITQGQKTNNYLQLVNLFNFNS